MIPLLALIAAIHAAPFPDTAYVSGNTLVVSSLGVEIGLPPEWLEAPDIKGARGCAHSSFGSAPRRLAVTREMLDSLRNGAGEWDAVFSAVADSTLPFPALVAQVGPHPFGTGHGCFGQLQMRAYVLPTITSWSAASRKTHLQSGLQTAQHFFSSAELSSRHSLPWHVDALAWIAQYTDYGANAYLQIYSAPVKGRTLVLVFMYGQILDNMAAEDEKFILDHVRFR